MDCSKCSMPIDDKNKCACEEGVCCKCCSCPEDCSCGCKAKDKKAPFDKTQDEKE